MDFQAAILTELNTPLLVETIGSSKLKYGQVMIDLKTSGICGAQLNEISGVKGPDKFLPHLMGHEGGGVVVAVGDGVSKVKPGDHVVLHWRPGSGLVCPFPSFKWGDRHVGAGLVTTFSQYSIVAENRVTTVDTALSFESAALLGCSTTTALGIVSREAKIEVGQSVLVGGGGGLGLSIAQAANLVSANPITVFDKNKAKEDLALKNGADYFLHCEVDALESETKSIVGSTGYDLAIDTTGNLNVINALFGCLAKGGTLMLVGQPRTGSTLNLTDPLRLFSNRKIVSSDGGLTNPDIDIPRYSSLILSNKINLEKIITHRFELSQVNEALDVVRSGIAGRVTLNTE